MKLKKFTIVSIVLLAILTFGAVNAADDMAVDDITTADDSKDIEISLPNEEITTGGEIAGNASAEQALQSDNAVGEDEILGAPSSNDVLGDDYDEIITPENIGGYGPHIMSGNLKFVGVFENSFDYLILDPGCIVDGSEATFVDMGIILTDDVQINGLTMTSTRYLEDNEMGIANGALVYITGMNNIIDNLDLNYAPEEGHDVYGVLIENAQDFKITNSLITFTGTNLADYYEYAMKIIGAQGSNLLKGNTIVANLPILNVDYSKGNPGLDTDLVLNTGIKESEGIDIIGNTFIANVIDRYGDYPTLDCVMIENSPNINIIDNTLIENDPVTQSGETNYLNVLDMYYSSNVLVKGNTIHVESDGGCEDAGTSYCIQLTGPYEEVVIDGNDLYSHCYGPALGIYSQNYYGGTEILVQNNNIDVTGLPTYGSWGLVSGIELQDDNARVYKNDIKTHSILGYCEDGMNLYGISYAQALNEDHNYEIIGNTIETEGPYAIYLLKAQDTTIAENFLLSSAGEGDATVYIDNAQGTTTIENNEGRGNFYVSPYGDDGNLGSEDSPLQTIEAALFFVPEGGKIILLEGEHILDHHLDVEKSVSIIGKTLENTILVMQQNQIINTGVSFDAVTIKNIQFVDMPDQYAIFFETYFNSISIENCIFNVENIELPVIVSGEGNFNFKNNIFNIVGDTNDVHLIGIGGAITGDINHNIFNSISAIDHQGSELVNANYNYWGTNEPSEILDTMLTLENIVIADVSVNPSEIMAGESATVTVDFNKVLDLSSGEITRENKVIPDAITVGFAASEGTLSDSELRIQNGVATTTYTAGDVNDNIVVTVPNQEITKAITVISLGGDVEINVTDTWVDYSSELIATLPVESGTATIKVNGKTVATTSFEKGKLTYTIKASDIQSGVNTVEVSVDGASGQKTFIAYDYDGVVTADTFFNYFNASNSNRLCDHVPKGAVLDFQGEFISTSSVSYIMEIDKPVNMISSTKDAYINLNTIAQGMQGENPGDRFTVSYGGSGSNISDISFYNSQLWFFNTHNLTINNMTSIVDGREIGSGVGVVAFRGGSSHIKITNSYFSTKDNGGHSNFVLTNASYISVDHSSIIGQGNVGNLIYLNLYNMELPDGMYLPQVIQMINKGLITINDHNNFTNCYIKGPDTPLGICYLFASQGNGFNIFENNTVIYGGAGIQSFGNDGIIRGNNFTGGCGINSPGARTLIANNNITDGTITASGDNEITGNRVITTGNYAVDLGKTKNNNIHDNYLVSANGKGDAAVNLGTGSNNVISDNGPADVEISISIENTDFWLPATNTVTITTDATGAIEIRVNGKTVATETAENGQIVYTIQSSDIKAGVNTVTAIYQGVEESATFNVYGLVTNETWDEYFDADNSGRLKDWVPEGAVLDFQGKFLSSPDKMFVMEIDKPVNIFSSTKDAYIDLNTTAGSLMGENPGDRFTVSYGGSGSNISDLYFHNTQLWLYNTHNVTLDGISAVVEDQRVGSGVGATAIRANSTYVTVKNSYFYTKDNGGSTSVALSWADYCTLDNNTFEVVGNVGNMIYLNTFNIDIPQDVVPNCHNVIKNNVIYGPATAAAICWAITINGQDNLIDNNTVYYKGVGLAAAMGGTASRNIYTNNKLYNATSMSIGGMGTFSDCTFAGNYISGNVNVGAGCEVYDNVIEGTVTATNANIHDNVIGGTVTLDGADASASGTIENLIVKSDVNVVNANVTGTLTFIGSNSVVSDSTVNNVVFGDGSSKKATDSKLMNSTVTGTVTTSRYSTGNSIIGNNITQTVTLQGTNDIIYQNNIITTTEYAVDASSSRASKNNISDNYLISNGKKGNAAVTFASGKNHIVENNGPDMALEDIADVLIGEDNVVVVNIMPSFMNTTVTIKVNDKIINETSAGGIFNQVIKASDINLGVNTVEVTAYDKTVTKTFNAFEIIIEVAKEINLGNDNEATITISGATGDVIVKLNGNQIATPTLQGGSVTQTISAADIIEGENTVEVTYNGFTNSTTFNAVKKAYEIIIEVENTDMWLNGPNSVTVTIAGENGTVSIRVNGKEIATSTLSEGSVTQTIEISDMINGENTVEVTYDGVTNSTTFNAQDNVVTPENFDIFFDDMGQIKDEVPFDELVFKGVFDAPVDYLILLQPITITGDNAVLNNMGVYIEGDNVKLDKLNFIADTSLGSLIAVAGSNVDLTNLNIDYTPGDEEAVAIDINECRDVHLLNSTILFESNVPDDTVFAVGLKITSCNDVLVDGNDIITKLPCVYVNTYDEDYFMMGSDKVNPVRLKDCTNLVFTNNFIDSTTNDYSADFPTIQAIQIIGCHDSILDHNNISMIDEMTPAGMDNYLYGINFGYNTNVTFSYNNFNMSTSGGKDAAGTAYAFQGVESEVLIIGNNITSISNGPNLGIYVASMFGGDSDLLIIGNFINVTGAASSSGSWALVSGIEIQNGEAKIYNNTIYTYNVNEYDDAAYMYGISYAQWMYGTRAFDIQNNTVYTEGKYTISVIDADYLYAGNNTLYAHDLSGDDSINPGDCEDVELDENLPPKANIIINVDNSWAGEDNTVLINVSNANENGRITVTLNDKVLFADTELTAGLYAFTIDAGDLKIGENNITVSYAGDLLVTDNVASELFEVIGNVVTQDNFYSYFDNNGNLLSDIPFDELIFSGEFEDLVSYITLERTIKITGENAVLNNIGFILAGDEIVIDNLKFVADEDLGNLIDIAGENVVISNNDISYVVSEAANAINVYPGANGAQILDNTIYFESTVDEYTVDEVTNAICVNSGINLFDDEADPITGLVISGNNITAIIPAFLADVYEQEYYVMGLSAVNGVRINGAEDFEFTDNNLDVSTNYLYRTTPTYQALYVASSSGLIDGNNISMIDTFTPEGKDVYLYAVQVIYDENLVISNNNFNLSTKGGKAEAGAAYAITGIASDFSLIRNNITTVSNGPNLAVYLPSSMGAPCDLIMTGNFINVTGLATKATNFGLVSGIEVQTGDVEIKENIIYTQSIGEYDKDNYLYGISYVQDGLDSSFVIADNEIYTGGYYTISLKSAADAEITGNYLIAAELFGDDSVIINSGSGYTVEDNRPYALNLTVKTQNITVGEDAIIAVTYNELATGSIQVIVNGNVYTVENSGEEIVVSDLAAGEHIIKVIFESDSRNFISEEDIVILNVSKKDSEMNITLDSDAKLGEDVLINVTLPEDASGDVIIVVDGEEHIVPVNNGNAEYTIENITSGDHSIVVMYSGDKNYAFAYNATALNIDKIQSEVNVTVIAGKAGEKSVVKVNVTEGASGTVVVDVNGTKYTLDLAVSSELELVLDAGDYPVVAAYSGDDNYDSSVSDEKVLTVADKLAANIKVEVPDDINVGDNILINVTADTTADLAVTIDGVAYAVEDGKVSFVATSNGLHSINVVAGENGEFKADNKTVSFVADKKDAVITINEISANVGENITVTPVTDSDGALTVKINGEVVTGEYEITKPGSYTVTVESAETDSYKEGFAMYIFTAKEIKAESNVTINVPSDIKEGDNVNVAISIPNATGYISVIVDGNETIAALDENGTASVALDNISAGNHDVVVIYSGDDKHNATYVVKTFEVPEHVKEKTNATISIPTDFKPGDNITVSIPNATGNLSVIVDGKEIIVPLDENGTANVALANISVGDHNVVLIYPGDKNHEAMHSSFSFTSVDPRLETKFDIAPGKTITSYAVDYGAGERTKLFKIKLTDSNGNPIANAAVKFKYKSKTMNLKTDANGFVSVGIDTYIAGTYAATLTYAGDDTHKSTSVNFKFKLNKKKVTIKAKSKKFKAKVKVKKYTITLKTKKFASKNGKAYLKKGLKVTLKIKGKTYKAKINKKGKATFKIKKLTKKGTYKAKIKFAGNKTYKGVTKKVKIRVI